MLVIDTNVLLWCILGKASKRIDALQAKGVLILVTDQNVDECWRTLVSKFGISNQLAAERVAHTIAPLEVLATERYTEHRSDALARLGQGGSSDWPALAAAIALDADIWSDDRDYFGVGVAVWSTPNTRHASPDRP